MYELLQTSSKTLITIGEVIYASPSNTNVDARFINTAIEIAEKRFIKPAICTDFYNDFRSRKNQTVTIVNLSYLQSLMPSGAKPLEVGQIVNSIDFVTDVWYKDFWNECLWKAISECVIYIASPANYSRFTASGEQENNPSSLTQGKGSASVDLATMKWKMDRMMQDRIDPMIAVLDEYLHSNRTYFNLLNCKNWQYDNVVSDSDGVSIQRKTAWIHGVYNDSRGNGCGCGCKDDY